VGEVVEQFGAPVAAVHGVVFDAAGVGSPAAGRGQDPCVPVPFERRGHGGCAERRRDRVMAVCVVPAAGEVGFGVQVRQGVPDAGHEIEGAAEADGAQVAD